MISPSSDLVPHGSLIVVHGMHAGESNRAFSLMCLHGPPSIILGGRAVCACSAAVQHWHFSLAPTAEEDVAHIQ